jgi:hypothetical protein
MNAPTPPHRRWYQLSLRTMLLTMIVASAAFGYLVHWSKDWIRQRQKWMNTRGGVNHSVRAEESRAPGGLWIFGEEGAATVAVKPGDEAEAKRLYPDAAIVTIPR